jgi:RNA polymerase sigma-70 factor (ECF subfamily)
MLSRSSAADQQSSGDPTVWLDRFGDLLYRYARSRVHRDEAAEDLVQETLLAALEARNRGQELVSEQAWLMGILRHKIIDHFRRARQVDTGPDEVSFRAPHFFQTDGHWKSRPQRWPADPHSAMENREFWEVFERCRSQLPGGLSAAFVLRELEQMETQDTCRVLGISQSNLFVRLHRARLLLRACLERHWFSVKG